MNEFIYDDELNILRVNITGYFGINEVNKLYKYIISNDNYSSYFKLLIDFRNAKIINMVADSTAITKINNEFYNNFIQLRKAIIIDKPIETAILMCCFEEKRSTNYNSKVFSAESNALTWLICKTNEEYMMKQMHKEIS